MDNLTHSLVGAVMGRMGLKRVSPRAMPALIIAANLPDIDSFVAPVFGVDPLAAHRGFTHGIGGLVIMPFLAVAIIWIWEKVRPGKEGPLKLGGLLLACFLAVLSHPLLDFATSYGTRLLEPFSHRWFYGDTLFIMDPWIWIMLILMPHEGFPIALGVIYEDPAPTFESAIIEQNRAAASGKTPDLQALVAKGQTWQVEKEPHKI